MLVDGQRLARINREVDVAFHRHPAGNRIVDAEVSSIDAPVERAAGDRQVDISGQNNAAPAVGMGEIHAAGDLLAEGSAGDRHRDISGTFRRSAGDAVRADDVAGEGAVIDPDREISLVVIPVFDVGVDQMAGQQRLVGSAVDLPFLAVQRDGAAELAAAGNHPHRVLRHGGLVIREGVNAPGVAAAVLLRVSAVDVNHDSGIIIQIEIIVLHREAGRRSSCCPATCCNIHRSGFRCRCNPEAASSRRRNIRQE